MEMQLCQSCGMELSEDILGTNTDGTKNIEYCMHCYQAGAYSADLTMDEMANYWVDYLVKEESKEEAQIRKEIHALLSTLKRWSA